MKKKIFVTGADGFIGANLVNYLIDKNYQVKALCKYNSQNYIGWLNHIDSKKLKKVKILFGDVRDQFFLDQNIKNVDIVFNLAALVAIPYSYISPESYIDTNIKGTLNCLLSSKKNKVEHFFQISTSEVYGSAQYVPIDENHPISTQSPYAASKSGADQIAMAFYKSYGLPVTILRPFNNYGKFQSARAIIPTIILQCLNDNKFIKVGSVSTKRDFLYVEDTVRAFEQGIKKRKKIIGQTINLGTGNSESIRTIIEIIQNTIKSKKLIKIDKKRIRPKNSEVNHLIANNNKAKKLLNWKPKYTGKKHFKKSILEILDWYKKNKKIFNSKDFNI